MLMCTAEQRVFYNEQRTLYFREFGMIFSFGSNEKYISITSNLAITVVVYGLGLNEEGPRMLVSTTLEEHNVVMKCAFQSFTQNEDSHNIGMVN